MSVPQQPRPHRNAPIYNHPLMGTTHTYRPDQPAYDTDAPDPDREHGALIVANGMEVGVKQVFRDWNAVPGLDMLYVYVFHTGQHTHVTPFDLGLTPLAYEVERGPMGVQRLNVSGGEPFTWVPLTQPEVDDYLAGYLAFDSSEYVKETDDGLLVPDYLIAAHREVTP